MLPCLQGCSMAPELILHRDSGLISELLLKVIFYSTNILKTIEIPKVKLQIELQIDNQKTAKDPNRAHNASPDPKPERDMKNTVRT